MTVHATFTAHDDELLLQQLRQNSKSAFNQLFEKYWEWAYSNAHRRLKDADQAKDIVQDIFAHIWLHRATNHIQNFPAYLHTAIRNKVIKIISRQKVTHPFLDPPENMSGNGGIEGNAGNADQSLLWKEFHLAYEACLNSLPPQRQTIFRLRFHDDLPTKAIASLMGLSRKTVQNQLGIAVEKLRASVIGQWGLLFLISIILKKIV